MVRDAIMKMIVRSSALLALPIGTHKPEPPCEVGVIVSVSQGRKPSEGLRVGLVL